MRWIQVGILALGLGIAVTAASPRAAQEGCESAAEIASEQKTRRSALIGLARDIINAQHQSMQKGQGYQPFASLTLNRPAPDGVNVKLTAEPRTFSFSIVDKTGPCQRFGVFSNEDGLIYLGRPLQ